MSAHLILQWQDGPRFVRLPNVANVLAVIDSRYTGLDAVSLDSKHAGIPIFTDFRGSHCLTVLADTAHISSWASPPMVASCLQLKKTGRLRLTTQVFTFDSGLHGFTLMIKIGCTIAAVQIRDVRKTPPHRATS
ncbi:MAG: hypothetical protein R2788_19080 [Saprospiraceae bacterium]